MREIVAHMNAGRAFTPALGFRALTPLYDAAIALLTRETVWRSELIRAIGLNGGERLLDVGCGTGSLAVRLAKLTPESQVIGIDPDPDVLRLARAKAAEAGVTVSFHQGLLTPAFFDRQPPFDVIASSLVLHQVPLDGKAEIIALIRKGLKPGGRFCVADYGMQRTPMMRLLFRATVQSLDGVTDTQPNADGVLPTLMSEAGFVHVEDLKTVSTPTGSITIFVAR